MWFFAKKHCMRRDALAGTLSWWSCQSPVAHSCCPNITGKTNSVSKPFGNYPNSFLRGMFKLNAIFDVASLLYSLNHFERDGHTVQMLIKGIYHPHWLVQWSCHCSPMSIPVHSPWIPGYTNVTQTILIVLAMAWFFLDRPHHWSCSDASVRENSFFLSDWF